MGCAFCAQAVIAGHITTGHRTIDPLELWRGNANRCSQGLIGCDGVDRDFEIVIVIAAVMRMVMV